MNYETYKNEAGASQNWLYKYFEEIFHKNYEFWLKIIQNALENTRSAITIYILHYNLDFSKKTFIEDFRLTSNNRKC